MASLARAYPPGKLPPHVLNQNPTGSWSFVGRVNADLAYESKDGSPATEDQLRKAAHFGPRLAGVRSRSWPTKDAALAALAESEEGSNDG